MLEDVLTGDWRSHGWSQGSFEMTVFYDPEKEMRTYLEHLNVCNSVTDAMSEIIFLSNKSNWKKPGKNLVRSEAK